MCGRGDHPPYDQPTYADGIEMHVECGHAVDDHDRRGEDGECFECNRQIPPGPCAKKMSEQMVSLIKRYGLPEGTTEQQLLIAVRDDRDRECLEEGEKPTPLSVAEVWLDRELEAEYQRLASR